MVINLRVKTLDSQDHEFSVEDDITVRQLKERIHEKTNVEIDLQRLIYCGRVMNDDHPLSDYNVNGKVIHLVQRPPPGTTRASSSSNTESASTDRHRNTDGGRNNVPFIHVLDGTVLGAMAIPMNTNSGTTQSITHSMNPSSTLCMNRITVARHMLNCVNNIANYLENPERGLNNTDMDILAQQTMESTVFEVGISAVSDPDVPQQDVQNVVQLFQGAVSAAFQQNGLPNITVDSVNGTTQATIPLVFGATAAPAIEMNAATLGNPTVRVIGVSQNPNGTNSQSASSSSTSSNSTTSSSSSTSTNQTRSSDQNTSDSSDEASSNSQQTTSPQTLAEVVQQMRTVQTRLEPFIQQYYDILQNEPTFEENDTSARESAQRIFDRVSEALHYFSHAQHAISDLMLDLSSNTPRHLCCRPILVEQSAFVSSGFAIPSMIHHIPRRTDANGNNNTNNNNNNNTNNNNNNNATANNNASQNTNDGAAVTESTATRRTNVSSDTISQSLRSAATQFPVARLIQAVMDSVPANADVHVEINQNTPVGFESQIEIQPQQQQSANSTSSTTTNTNSETGQFRVTTATHPTTSTQTRSTARPHATTGIPVGQIRNLRPAMQLSSFDRYLPCNSHHIHEPENQQQQQQQQQRQSQQQSQQQPQPRANRINIQRTPQVHIQRSVPNSVRFANFLSNHLQNQLQQRSTAAPAAVSSAPTTPLQTSAPSNASLSSNSLNDSQLNTVIPIFGSNEIQLQIRDLVNVSPTPTTLNRIRSELREFLMVKLSLNSSPSEENVALAVNHVISLLNQFFLMLPELSIPDYDARASIENLMRRTLPVMIRLIRDDESVEFGTQMLHEISEFSKKFIVILLHSIGRPSAQDYLKNVVEAIFTSIFASAANEDTSRVALQWLRRHINDEILRRFQDIRLDSIDVIEFLVIRRPPPPTPTDQRPGDLMETDADDETNNETMNAEANEPAEDVEPLPTITFGSESWHSNFPAPWLPIITRDISRQRRQSPQRPFSDAYLSGMSSKRRKLINNSKPAAAEPNNILPQSVRHVLQSRISHGSSGASTSSASVASTAASIDDAISTNQHINEPYGSYETAILSHVQNRIRTDTNFTPERFPNCSKWINKNK
ncbi:large proline-rich protein BAG6 isoform X2 [Contarinia nasturtii]|uniref:large proline-rich protein BAG6 isoform X2 n=1 Tax=Contarinia nasturtii TaxID=265458 RepID=UPI0012D410D0|nr:large proline-rich protein BAG6 isoform X2 [Contarinia nasturtii]